MQAECRPVAKGNGDMVGQPVLVTEPGPIRWRLSTWWTTGAREEFALVVTESKAGQDAGDQLASFPASAAIPPFPYSALAHPGKVFPAFSRLQYPFDFGRTQ